MIEQVNEIGNKIIEIITKESDYYDAFWRVYELKESDRFKDKNLDPPASKNKEARILFTHILDAVVEFCHSEKLSTPTDYPSMNVEYFEDFDMYYGGIVYQDLAFLFIAVMRHQIFVLQSIQFESNITKYHKFYI